MQERDRLLRRAFVRGDGPAIEHALAAGANPELTFAGTPMLTIAAIRGDVATVERLLAAGGNPNAPDPRGNTPLHAVAGIGTTRDRHPEIMDLLVRHRADVNAVNANGLTPLDFAASTLNREMCDRLVAAGGTCRENDGLLNEVYQRDGGRKR